MKDGLNYFYATLFVVGTGVLFGFGFAWGFSYMMKDHVIAIAPIERKAQ